MAKSSRFMTKFMTKEQLAILDLLNGKWVPRSVEWQRVYQLSVEQGVAALVFDEVQRLYAERGEGLDLPTDVKLKWYIHQHKVEERNREVNKVLAKITAILEGNGIPSILLKGQGLAQLYPNPQRRMPGDIDLYVGAENYQAAREMIAAQRWLSDGRFHEDIKHLGFCVDGVMIELHRHAAIIPGRKSNAHFQMMMSGVFDAECPEFHVGDVAVKTLPTDVNVVYTFVHLFKHFIESGVTLRQLMDWKFLLEKSNCEGVPKDTLQEMLTGINHLKAWQTFGCVMVKYLGVDTDAFPFYSERYADHADKIMELVFDDTKHKSRMTGHADGFVNKMKVLASMASNFGRISPLFPKECQSYSFLLLKNALAKQIRIAKGQM